MGSSPGQEPVVTTHAKEMVDRMVGKDRGISGTDCEKEITIRTGFARQIEVDRQFARLTENSFSGRNGNKCRVPAVCPIWPND
jgi:hypothetical protein